MVIDQLDDFTYDLFGIGFRCIILDMYKGLTADEELADMVLRENLIMESFTFILKENKIKFKVKGGREIFIYASSCEEIWLMLPTKEFIGTNELLLRFYLPGSEKSLISKNLGPRFYWRRDIGLYRSHKF